MEKITELMDHYVRNNEIAGAAVCVQRDGREIYRKSFGMADRENRIPVTERTVFRLASMTKPIIAIAVMKLAEADKLRLEDRLSDYIPAYRSRKVVKEPVDMMKFYNPDPDHPLGPAALEELKRAELVDAKREVTIYDCLSHSSGVGMGPVSGAWLEKHIRAEIPLAERVELYAQAPGDFQPGEASGYSAVAAFDSLGRVIEIVSGMDLNTFLRKEIFEPLGIRDITYLPDLEQQGRLCRLYEYEEKTRELTDVSDVPSDLQLVDPRLYGYFSGGAGLFGTLEDYCKIAQLLVNRGSCGGVRILKEDTVDKMAGKGIPHDKVISPGMFWGLGMAVFNDPQKAGRGLTPGSYGWSGAYGTHFYIDPCSRLTTVLMVNRSNCGGAGSYISLALEQAVYDSYISTSG